MLKFYDISFRDNEGDFNFCQILAMSEIDARNLMSLRGITPLDIQPSIELIPEIMLNII